MSYRQRFNYQLDRHCSKTRVAARVTYTHYVTAVRCAEADKRELEKAVAAEAATDMWAPVVRAVSTIKGIDVASAFCLAAEAGCGVRELVRSRPLRALLRGEGVARPHHQDGERGLEEDARRGGMALRELLGETQEAAKRVGGVGRDQEAGRRLHEAPREEARRAHGVRAQQVRRQRRRGQGARLLGLGNRVPCRGHIPGLAPSPHSPSAGVASLDAGLGPAHVLFIGQPPGGVRCGDWTSRRGSQTENRTAVPHPPHIGLAAGPGVDKSPRILACQASAD